jgi:hypothetical protein
LCMKDCKIFVDFENCCQVFLFVVVFLLFRRLLDQLVEDGILVTGLGGPGYYSFCESEDVEYGYGGQLKGISGDVGDDGGEQGKSGSRFDDIKRAEEAKTRYSQEGEVDKAIVLGTFKRLIVERDAFVVGVWIGDVIELVRDCFIMEEEVRFVAEFV